MHQMSVLMVLIASTIVFWALFEQAAGSMTLFADRVIDRNILRLAVYELLRLDDVPPKVSINEAVHLAKTYASTQSGAFVNGVLDRILRECATAPDASDG